MSTSLPSIIPRNAHYMEKKNKENYIINNYLPHFQILNKFKVLEDLDENKIT